MMNNPFKKLLISIMIKLAMVKGPGNTVGYYQISMIQIMLHACRMKCFTTMVVNILLLISSILCIPSQELTPCLDNLNG